MPQPDVNVHRAYLYIDHLFELFGSNLPKADDFVSMLLSFEDSYELTDKQRVTVWRNFCRKRWPLGPTDDYPDFPSELYRHQSRSRNPV